MSRRRVIAVIPAAGRGKRMGQLKQLLPFRSSTMMETVIATAVNSEVDGVVVVVNEDVRLVAERHASERCRIAINPDPDSDMLKSIQIGWRNALSESGLMEDDGIMILPADQPEIAVDAISDVICVYQGRDPVHAVVATYGMKSGHPAIYPSAWIAETLAWPPGLGLNELANRHARRVIPAPQAGPLPLDVNTPDDFARVVPGPDETRSLKTTRNPPGK